MIIQIKVHPQAKHNQVVKVGETYLVSTTAKAINNQANLAVIDLLAQYFRVKKNQVLITRGHQSRLKAVRIIFNDHYL